MTPRLDPTATSISRKCFPLRSRSLTPRPGTSTDFASSPFPLDLTWSAAGDLWVGDLDNGVEEYNSSGGDPIAYYGSFDSSAGEPSLSGNVWDTNIAFDEVYQYASNGSFLTGTFFEPYQPGLAVLGDVPGEQPLPLPNSPYYSFTLNQGESASIVVQSLNDDDVSFTLFDENGDVLGYGGPGATNYTDGLNNFVAPYDGTYYVEITGDAGTQFNLVVTRGGRLQHPAQ